MPFKSTAQQRFMYARHPAIAHRWSEEMKGAHRKGARKHPIKAANLPQHVGKSTRSALESSRRAHQLAVRFAQRGDLARQSRALGVRNASRERYQQGRVQEARESMINMPKRRGARKPVVKRDLWAADMEVPIVPEYRGRRANYRAGTAAVGKRMTGAVTGVASPKRVRPTRGAARRTPGAGIQTKPNINFDLVGKAFGGPVRRAKTYAEWSGRVGAPSGTGIGPKTRARAEQIRDEQRGTPVGRRAGSIVQRDDNRKGTWRGNTRDGRHVNLDDTRWESGVYGVNTKQQRKMATEARRRKDGLQVSPVKRRRGVALNLEMYEHPDDFTRRVRGGQFHKRDRSYNPEARRQRRLGGAAALTAGAGGLLMHRGAKGIHEATNIARRGIPFAPTAGRPAVILEEGGKKTRVIPVPQRLRQRADDLHSRGLTGSRGDLAQIGGGAALLGASGGIAHHGRTRANREWR